MFSLLTDKLEDTFRKLRGLGKISESNVADAMKEIRMALLEADVDFKVANRDLSFLTEPLHNRPWRCIMRAIPAAATSGRYRIWKCFDEK
jgi:hypothetical protein